MNIGLVGVPGSGKTDLAQKLSKALDGEIRIIDNYVGELEKKVDYVYGRFATYIGNLNIAMHRINTERKVRISTVLPHTVTCGTVVDTLAYMVLEAASTDPYDGFERRMLSSLATVGCLYHDTFDYDVVAFMPTPEKPETFINDLDDAMAQTFEQFGTELIVIRDDKDPLAPILTRIHELELAKTN